MQKRDRERERARCSCFNAVFSMLLPGNRAVSTFNSNSDLNSNSNSNNNNKQQRRFTNNNNNNNNNTNINSSNSSNSRRMNRRLRLYKQTIENDDATLTEHDEPVGEATSLLPVVQRESKTYSAAYSTIVQFPPLRLSATRASVVAAMQHRVSVRRNSRRHRVKLRFCVTILRLLSVPYAGGMFFFKVRIIGCPARLVYAGDHRLEEDDGDDGAPLDMSTEEDREGRMNVPATGRQEQLIENEVNQRVMLKGITTTTTDNHQTRHKSSRRAVMFMWRSGQKLRLGRQRAASYSSNVLKEVDESDHVVDWGESVEFDLKIPMDGEKRISCAEPPCTCRVSIRTVNRQTGLVEKYGYVDIDLTELAMISASKDFLGPPVMRQFLLQGYKRRPDNSVLSMLLALTPELSTPGGDGEGGRTHRRTKIPYSHLGEYNITYKKDISDTNAAVDVVAQKSRRQNHRRNLSDMSSSTDSGTNNPVTASCGSGASGISSVDASRKPLNCDTDSCSDCVREPTAAVLAIDTQSNRAELCENCPMVSYDAHHLMCSDCREQLQHNKHVQHHPPWPTSSPTCPNSLAVQHSLSTDTFRRRQVQTTSTLTSVTVAGCGRTELYKSRVDPRCVVDDIISKLAATSIS